jgi:hypothetical protein
MTQQSEGVVLEKRQVSRAVAEKETKAKAKKIQKMKKEFQDVIHSVEESAKKAGEVFGKRDAPSMRRMYQKDAKDLWRVYNHWSQGRYNEADEVAWKMDTSAREHIPDSVWQDIQRKIGVK